jgi:teichoic acid transport system permease protein
MILFGARRGLFAYLRDLWRRRDFVWNLALANVRGRHASTSLGLAWWVLDPLLLGSIFLLVFGVILETRRGDPNYIAFLLSGLFAFFYTRRTMTAGATAIQLNSQMVATQRFPRLLLPMSAVIEGGIAYLFSLIPFFLIAGLVGGDWPGPTIVWLPLAFLLQTLFNFGLTLLVAQLVLPFRDIGNVMQYVARVWMYLSPVIYPLDIRLKNVSETLFEIFSFNPMASILAIYRHALLGREMAMRDVYITMGWTVLFLVVGVVTFVRMEHKIPRYLA